MAKLMHPVGAAILYRGRQIATTGAGGNLREQPKERTWYEINTAIYTGRAHVRVFDCAKGYVATARAGDLLLGTVLPVVWGGVATSKAEDPRLQKVKRGQQTEGGMDTLIATYVEIYVR